MGASTYTRNNVLNALLRGTEFPLPAGTYVSLHTGDPGTTGANEVTAGIWTGYARRNAEGGGAIGSGWSNSTAGSSVNSKQITYPTQDGASPVTITHLGVWDALSAGNFLGGGALTTPRTLDVGDVFVFDLSTITATHT